VYNVTVLTRYSYAARHRCRPSVCRPASCASVTGVGLLWPVFELPEGWGVQPETYFFGLTKQFMIHQVAAPISHFVFYQIILWRIVWRSWQTNNRQRRI